METYCNYSMKIVGERKNIDSFVSALKQEGQVCMGKGAIVNVRDDFSDSSILYGEVAWSLVTALIGSALSMRDQKEIGKGFWTNFDGYIDTHEFITLTEASGKFDVDVEAYSTDPGCGFAEHILVKNGENVVYNKVPYHEIWLDKYNNYEEFSALVLELAEKIDEKKFEEYHKLGIYQTLGGFESTDFSI